jgi:hypothetical protein
MTFVANDFGDALLSETEMARQLPCGGAIQRRQDDRLVSLKCLAAHEFPSTSYCPILENMTEAPITKDGAANTEASRLHLVANSQWDRPKANHCGDGAYFRGSRRENPACVRKPADLA